MTRTTIMRAIDALPARVVETIADINNFKNAIPHIVDAGILSETKSGLGARFRETRLFGGKESAAEMETTEYVESEKVRIAADTHGTVWNSRFAIRPAEEKTDSHLLDAPSGTMDDNGRTTS